GLDVDFQVLEDYRAIAVTVRDTRYSNAVVGTAVGLMWRLGFIHGLFQPGQNLGTGPQGGGPVVIVLRQGAQRLKELRSQQQNQQTTEQRKFVAGAKFDITQQSEADIDRQYRNRHRGEKFEYR